MHSKKLIIESVHASGLNTLIHLSDGTLLITGDNTGRKTGINTTNKKRDTFDKPVALPFKLESDEGVKRFFCYARLIFILTSKNRLYLPTSLNSQAYNELEAVHHRLESDTSAAYYPDSETDEEVQRQPSPVPIRERRTSAVKGAEWEPLNWAAFEDLSEAARIEYLFQASTQVTEAMHNNAPWTLDGRLKPVLEQIETLQNIVPGTVPHNIERNVNEYLFPTELQELADPIQIKSGIKANFSVINNVQEFLIEKNGFMFTINTSEALRLFVVLVNTPEDGLIEATGGIALKAFEGFGNIRELATRIELGSRVKLNSPMSVVELDSSDKMCMMFDINNICQNCIGAVNVPIEQGEGAILAYSDRENISFLKDNTYLHVFDKKTQRLVKFARTSIGNIFANLGTQFAARELVLFDKKGVYCGTTCIKIREACPYANSVKAMFILPVNTDGSDYPLESTVLVLYEADRDVNMSRISYENDMICINIRGLNPEDYKLMSNWCFVFQENSMLHVLGDKRFSWDSAKSTRVAEYGSMILLTTPLPVPKSEIQEMKLDGSVIIKTEDTVYYAHSYDQFTFNSFSILLENETGLAADFRKKFVNDKLIKKYPKATGSEVTLYVQVGESALTTLLAMAQFHPSNSKIALQFKEGKHTICSDSNAKVGFFAQALKELVEQYFVSLTHMMTFNPSTVANNVKQYLIGKAMALAFNNIPRYLPFRMPVLLLHCITMRSGLIPLEELEYFAFQENSMEYQRLKTLNEASTITLDRYRTELWMIVHHHCPTKECDFVIASNIAEGFIENSTIPNLRLMNAPTLDCYLSGSYGINVEAFISKINFQEAALPYKSFILNLIRKMNQKELTSLVNNWSDSTVVDYNRQYSVDIDPSPSSDIYFQTHGKNLFFNAEIFSALDAESISAILCASK